jgi:LysM repeat protein
VKFKQVTLFVALAIALVATGLSPIQTLAQEGVQCQEEYIVQQGDWLSKVAEKYYGDVLAYNLIVQANNAQSDDAYPDIADPDLIEMGWTLCIPASSLAAETEVAPMGAEEAPSSEFRANSGLFSLRMPPDWVTEEHADGSGVIMANSTAALASFQQGDPPEAGDVVFNMTLVPLSFFGTLLLEVEPGLSTADLAAGIMPAFNGRDGGEVGETQFIALGDGREVAATMTANASAGGAMVLFEVAEGVVALSTIVGHPGEVGADDIETMAKVIIASLEFTGTVDELLEAIDPVQPPDAAFG